MQTVSNSFILQTFNNVRLITWAVLISFAKDFDDNIDFFSIGSSTIGGGDILKGDGSVVQEWDRYDYELFTERVLSVEINRETEPPTNPVSLATATIVLDNHDDRFTPGNTNSPLDGSILSKRPVRINLGFDGETIPKFVGLTEGKPEIDEREKTATFRCVDFLSSIMNKTLDEEVMYVDMRTDEIISELLQNVGGLLTTQFDLDYGTQIIKFCYFQKGSKLGDALREIAEAELGNVRMAENGEIIFQNRQNWNTGVSLQTVTKRDVLERFTLGINPVINVVEVFSRAREVQAKQKIWEAAGAIELPVGDTDIWADFRDDYGDLPLTTVDDPDYITGASTSLYATNEQMDGSGPTLSSQVSLDSTSLFSTSMKLTFTNSGPKTVWLTQLELFGTPAKVMNDIYERVVDATSVGDRDGFEENVETINNDLIQDSIAARTIGQIIISDRGEDDDRQRWLMRSIPHLQLGDYLTYQDENTDEAYFVTRINDIVNNSGYRQLVEVSKRTINEYFRIAISTIGGSDALGP